MKTRYLNRITFSLTPEEARELLELLPSKIRDRVGDDILEQLRPIYIYNVKCTDCRRVFIHESTTKLADERIHAGGICNNCMDDYK